MRLIEILQPQSVSEVGCKLGINQIILGAQFLPESLLDYSPAFSHDFDAHRRVQVKQGNEAVILKLGEFINNNAIINNPAGPRLTFK